MARKPKKAAGLKIDFSGVESRVPIPDGDYRCRVAEVTQEEGEKADYLKWKFEVNDGSKYQGSPLYNNTSLSPKALWNLKNLLITLGVEVPDDELDIDLEELVDLELMVVVANESYEGKRVPRVVDFYEAEGEAEADEDEDEKPAKKSKKAAADEDEDEKPAKRGRGRPKKEEADDEDEDEDEKPAKRGRGRPPKEEKTSKKSKKLDPVAASEVEDMDEEELAELVEKYDLGVELDEYKSMRRKVAAVIDALEDKELLED